MNNHGVSGKVPSKAEVSRLSGVLGPGAYVTEGTADGMEH